MFFYVFIYVFFFFKWHSTQNIRRISIQRHTDILVVVTVCPLGGASHVHIDFTCCKRMCIMEFVSSCTFK